MERTATAGPCVGGAAAMAVQAWPALGVGGELGSRPWAALRPREEGAGGGRSKGSGRATLPRGAGVAAVPCARCRREGDGGWEEVAGRSFWRGGRGRPGARRPEARGAASGGGARAATVAGGGRPRRLRHGLEEDGEGAGSREEDGGGEMRGREVEVERRELGEGDGIDRSLPWRRGWCAGGRHRSWWELG